MNVQIIQVKLNPDTTVRAMPTVQILWAVSCVHVGQALLEMELLAEVITYKIINIFQYLNMACCKTLYLI